MYYLIDDEKEIIFWISQKSGCTMFKNLVSKLSGKNIVGLNKLSFYKNSNNLNIDRSIKKKKFIIL